MRGRSWRETGKFWWSAPEVRTCEQSNIIEVRLVIFEKKENKRKYYKFVLNPTYLI